VPPNIGLDAKIIVDRRIDLGPPRSLDPSWERDRRSSMAIAAAALVVWLVLVAPIVTVARLLRGRRRL
jgi:hypothetical protein